MKHSPPVYDQKLIATEYSYKTSFVVDYVRNLALPVLCFVGLCSLFVCLFLVSKFYAFVYFSCLTISITQLSG